MKFSVSSSELLKTLTVVNGAINSNPVLPILEDFLLRIEGSTMTVAATDLETSIYTEIEVKADSDGVIAIPARILLETLKALPDQPITFTVDEDNFSIKINSAYGKYRIAGENGAEYPELPKAESVDTITLKANQLARGINKTLFATSNDELRPAMTGVFFQIDFNKVTCVATDAHKLVRYIISGLDSEVSTSFIVPKKALTLLKNALGGYEEVTVSFNKVNAFFEFGATRLACRLIDSRYPDYNAVIPTENPNVMEVRRSDFQNSLKRINIYANKTTNQVVLDISDNSLTVKAQDLDFNNEATEQMTCSYNGDPLTIGFNAKFLAEMLGYIESDDVKLEMSKPQRAGILVPMDQEEGEDILMLVMPVMLGS